MNKSKKLMKEKTHTEKLWKNMEWNQGLIISKNKNSDNCDQKYLKSKFRSNDYDLFFNKNIA